MAERYKIYEQLGAGGVGAVFRAYDNDLKRWVAIKRLMTNTEVSGDNNLASELRREADALASLRNPNIVTIFDVASDAEGLFMVMELLEGEDLADVVARGPLHYDDFKELASQTLEALLAAHQRHILHRDIKPENIKVERLPGGRMQSKIIDFGLARAGMRARKQTEDQEGTVMGSIFYMAPEQLTREPVDVRTDLYSLGCVFYEALSGRKAFDGDDLHAVIDMHINHDIVPLHVVAPHVPPWLGAWVLRLMAQKPEDRPATSQQAIEEFRAWEKMAAAPQMMPWMPAGPGYAPQGAYTQPMYGAGTVPLTGGVPAGDGTTGGIPVHPGYYQPVQEVYGEEEVYAQPVLEVIPEAEPVVEMAATTSPIARSGTGGVRHGMGSRTGQVQNHQGGGTARFIEEPESSSKGKIFAMIAVSLVVLAGGAWYFFFRGQPGKEVAGQGKSAEPAAPASTGLPKVTYKLPEDSHVYPPADQDACLWLVAAVGTRTTGNKPANPNDPVLEWNDLAELAQNNIMRALQKNYAYSPRRIIWPPPGNRESAGAKPGKVAFDFHPHAEKPVAMVLDEPAGEEEKFPFGSTAPKGDKGLTLGFVFQAETTRLPMRVLTLSGEGNASVVIRVDEKKQVVAQFRSGSSSATLTTKDLDATTPTTVALTWQASSGKIEFRVKDAPGKTFTQSDQTVASPGKPLTRLELGRVVDANKESVPETEHFVGILGELIMYSACLPLNQVQLLESKVLRDYYIQVPVVTAPPPKKAPPPVVKKATPAKAPAPAPAKKQP